MTHREQEEQVLMERTGQNDRSAFDEIVRRYQRPLQSYAARMLLSDQNTAADIAVEALVKLWERRGEYLHCDRLASWLYRTTHRLVLDHMLRGKTRPTPIPTDPGYDIQKAMEIRSEAEAARTAVSQLSFPLRTVFILSVYQEMSYQEIAETLEISTGTVASRKHEAVAALRRKLSAWKETQ